MTYEDAKKAIEMAHQTPRQFVPTEWTILKVLCEQIDSLNEEIDKLKHRDHMP